MRWTLELLYHYRLSFVALAGGSITAASDSTTEITPPVERERRWWYYRRFWFVGSSTTPWSCIGIVAFSDFLQKKERERGRYRRNVSFMECLTWDQTLISSLFFQRPNFVLCVMFPFLFYFFLCTFPSLVFYNFFSCFELAECVFRVCRV